MAAAMNLAGGTNTVASRKYFWLAAFDGTAPNALGTRRDTTSNGAGYDWRSIFHTTPAADTRPAEGRIVPAVLQPQDSGALQMTLPPHMTKELWSLLGQVNRDVNTKIHPIHDIDQFGFEDYWTLPIATGTMTGDCKDYVLEKRRLLMAAGVPMPALSITLGTTAWGEYHAVLLINTDQGDYVLDNLSPWVTPWKDVTYKWSKRQSNENPDIWVQTAQN